jgi:CheY-like chemotaxis protein
MALGSNFSEKKGLVVTDSPDLARLFLHSLRQVGLTETSRADGAKDAKKQLYKFEIDVVICAELSGEDYLDLLRSVRFELNDDRSAIPVICFAQNWDGALLPRLRDAGMSMLATLPFSLSSLLKTLTRAFSDPRPYVKSANYRGPCRRLRNAPDYTGPRRRASDAEKPSEPVRPSEPKTKSDAEAERKAARSRVSLADERGGASDKDEMHFTDPLMQQTKVVIDDAIVTASLVGKISQRLKATTQGGARADLLHQLADASERMVNLLLLANERIVLHGCDDLLLGRLGEIKAIIVKNTEELAEAAAHNVIEYGRKILADRKSVPLGSAEIMGHQLARLDSVVTVIGGVERLSATTKALVDQASKVYKSVAAREREIAGVLPEIGAAEASR